MVGLARVRVDRADDATKQTASTATMCLMGYSVFRLVLIEMGYLPSLVALSNVSRIFALVECETDGSGI